MATSLDHFRHQLVDSGLISAEAIAALIEELRPEKKPCDSEQLARELVRRKKLTAYQAQQIYAGKGKSLVLGNYVVLDKLGQGGMGLVLKAEHRRMERLVAVKVLSRKLVRTPDAVRRFQREVKAAAKLTHPNIVIAYDADEAGDTHFLVMEYVEGADLSSRVKRHGPGSLDDALDWVLQAARGLQYAHEHGVVHRDIKPANLLLDQQGTIKILDMGLARLDSAGAEQDQLTGSGQIMGTVDYMAPEQAADTKRADARADIYSLGVTLWYLLTGRPLFEGETMVEKLMAHQSKPVPSLASVRPEVSASLDAVFRRMVAKTPLDRYQTMAEVIAELEPFFGHGAKAATGSPAIVEDSRLDGFLQGRRAVAGPQRATNLGKTSPAVATKAPPPAAADLDITQDWSGSHVETATRIKPPLPPPESARAGTTSARSAAFRRAKPAQAGTTNWRDWRWLAMAGAGGLLVILLGIWIVVRDKDRKEVARVPVPDGGSVTVETAANSEAAKSAKSDDKAPQSKTAAAPPPPAIAPFDAAKAKEHQAAWAKYLGVEVESENSIGIRFVLIPPGEFDMGSTDAEVAKLLEQAKATNKSGLGIEDLLQSQAPKHRVRITKPFWLSVHEVTRGQFRRFVDDRGYQTEAERDGKGGYGLVNGQSKQDPRFVWNRDLGCEKADDHPVVNVTWNDVTAFCTWLSQKEGDKSQLPTEAQWEYACRAGTATRWYSGDDEETLREHAWFDSNAEKKPHPVGQKSPNAWGLYDMHGNVWEWCQDWWAYYATLPMDDPTGPAEGSCWVARGGCRGNDASWCRASHRGWMPLGIRDESHGFRLVRTVSLITESEAPSRLIKAADPLRSEDLSTAKRSATLPTPKPLPPWDVPDGAPPPAIAPFDGVKAKEHQTAWAKYLGVKVEMENSIGIKLVLIPPGEFDMGSTPEEIAILKEQDKANNVSSHYLDELLAEAPIHRVRITKPFWLGAHEVTRGQFRRFVDERGYGTEAELDGKGGWGSDDGQWKRDPRFVWNRDLGCEKADDHPVVNVTWNDVTAFCTWLSQKEGDKSQLPTEAQWEYACRAGTATRWYSGDDEETLREHAWFALTAAYAYPVGQKTPNAWGLYDMHGNVWEWCQDWKAADYYGASPLEDPTGPTVGRYRVKRGGGWRFDASRCLASFRHGFWPDYRDDQLGFRVARTVTLPVNRAAGFQEGGKTPRQSKDWQTPTPSAPATIPSAAEPAPTLANPTSPPPVHDR